LSLKKKQDKRFYHVEDTKNKRSGFYLAESPRKLSAKLRVKDGVPKCDEGELFTALRYKITRARVVEL
jgi:hypothetical protein